MLAIMSAYFLPSLLGASFLSPWLLILASRALKTIMVNYLQSCTKRPRILTRLKQETEWAPTQNSRRSTPRHSLYGRHHGSCSQTSVSLSRPLYQDRNGEERSDTEHTMECKTLRRTLCLRMAVVLLSCMNLHFIWFVFGLTLKGQKYFGLSKIRIIFSPTKYI